MYNFVTSWIGHMEILVHWFIKSSKCSYIFHYTIIKKTITFVNITTDLIKKSLRIGRLSQIHHDRYKFFKILIFAWKLQLSLETNFGHYFPSCNMFTLFIFKKMSPKYPILIAIAKCSMQKRQPQLTQVNKCSSLRQQSHFRK